MAKDDQPVKNEVLSLEPFKPLDAELTEAAADYGGLKIAGLDDRAGYESVVKAISRLVNLRTSIENARVAIKKPALDFGRRVDAEAKRLTNLVAGAEAKLREERNRVDLEKQRAKEAEERAALEKFKARTDALFAAGFVFDGVDYIAGSLHILAEGLGTLTDEKFDECIEMGKKEVAHEKARKLADKRPDPKPEQPADETLIVAHGDGVCGGDSFFEEQHETARNDHAFAFSAGFDKCRREVLAILDRPDKFSREQLRDLIRALQP